MFRRVLFSLLPLVMLVALPVFLRNGATSEATGGGATEKLIIVSPHTEPIKYEFTCAFQRHYREKYGVEIELDWRNVGGTADIVRYINDRYEASFRQYYEAGGGQWDSRKAEEFRNPKSSSEVRKKFLESDVGIGLDLFFGGGVYDQARFATMGYGVDAGIAGLHPEYFMENIIPESFSGDKIYDSEGRFYGVCLSSFGIAYNITRIKEMGVKLDTWRDLAQPALFQAVTVADPTKSGSVNKCFEMIMQQCIAEKTEAGGTLAEGWDEAFLLIKLIVANARYATDSAGKLVRDVSAGGAAAGMCIDFYGLSEAEWVNGHALTQRMAYFTPKNGSPVSADPIQLLRGAPNRRAAKAFIEFLLSAEGQKIWILKPGSPGGPEKYALRRPCVRRDLLEDESLIPYRSDPDYNPYETAGTFVYNGAWTGRYFNLIRVLIKVLALDTMDDLRNAWQTIIENGGPEQNPEAMAELRKMPFSYEDAGIASSALYPSETNTTADIAATRREWTDFARGQYRKAMESAKKKGMVEQ